MSKQKTVREYGQIDETGTPMVLRDFLFEQDLSQTEAAVKIGVTVSTLSKWERGVTDPTVKHLSNIELVFNLKDGRILFPRCWPHLIPEKYKA